MSHGLVSKANSSNTMNWFRSNFNMPVPNVLGFNGFTSSVWERYLGPANLITESYSYDLSDFSPGFEICVGLTMWDFDNNGGSPYYIDTTLYWDWKDPSGNIISNNGYIYETHYVPPDPIPPGYYAPTWVAANIGCAGWEISSSGTYHYRASASGTPSISVVDTSVTMSNVPNTSVIGTPGYIWVEGNNLAYINANQWKHSIVGADQGYVGGTPGYFWNTAGTLGLVWIGSDGHKYGLPWEIKQFYSYFPNSATGATYAGTANGGKIWVDNEFGYTHLAFISSADGYKYLSGAGDYPY